MSGCPWSLAPEVLETWDANQRVAVIFISALLFRIPFASTMLGDSQGDPVREE